jgi:hypothetical protein
MAEIRTFIEARRYGHLRGKRYYDKNEQGDYNRALSALKRKYPDCDYIDCTTRRKLDYIEWWANLNCGIGIQIAKDFFKKTLSQINQDDIFFLHSKRELIKERYLTNKNL